jgi:hypothetical protein
MTSFELVLETPRALLLTWDVMRCAGKPFPFLLKFAFFLIIGTLSAAI